MSGLLTNTRRASYSACPRLHRYRFTLCYRPVESSGAQRFGTLYHLAQEAWWGAAPRDRLGAALAVLDEADKEIDPFERAKAQALIVGYDARWGSEPYEVLGVEVEFRAPLINPMTGAASKLWTLAGKIDAVVRDPRSGRTLIVEHKTSSEDIGPGSEYWRRLRMDGQVSQYYEGARSLGFDVSGCIYDVIGKPRLKPLGANAKRKEAETPGQYRERIAEAIAEEPARYFQRGEVVRLEAEMAEAMFDVWQTGQLIRESERTGRAPRNPDACVRWGSTCKFFDVCTGAASLDDPKLFTRSENPFPELSETVTKQSSKEEPNGHTASSSAAETDPAAPAVTDEAFIGAEGA